MLGIFKRKSVDATEIIEMKKKIAYIETDLAILKTQYEKLLSRYKIEAMTDARVKKKEDDVDVQKIIAEITANPNISIQKIISENPKIVEKILKTQYERLLGRYKVEVMTDARQKKKEDDIDIQKIIAEIAANPKQSLQDVFAKNPDIIKKILSKL